MKTVHTKEELINELIEQLEDELEGIIEYDHLYESLKAHKMHHEAAVIEEIAGNEYKHVCALWEMLTDHEVDLSDHEDINSKWERVKKIFDI